MSRRRGPRRVWHRGRGRGRRAPTEWIKLIGLGGVILAFVGYLVWLYVQPSADTPAVYLPLIINY